MLKIQKDKNLTSYTTLGIGDKAEFFAVVKDKQDLIAAITWAERKKVSVYVLGGGSNLLISGPVRGLVLKNEIRGRKLAQDNKGAVLVEAKSGEDWAKFVDYTVSKGWHGLENLSLIYGTVGAAPIQNIGAYGVELKDSFDHLVAIDLKTGKEKIFYAADCRFGYRDSVFKRRLKGKYFIYSVTVRLRKKASLRLEYGSIKNQLAQRGVKKPTLKETAAAVKDIRRSKLPDPVKLPNAGSFFKNIELSEQRFLRLQVKYPDLPGWPAGAGKIKIPSAWLIEKAGFKGRRYGPLGMHERQALVMVNYDGATPRQASALAQKIKLAIQKRFGLDLQEEINII